MTELTLPELDRAAREGLGPVISNAFYSAGRNDIADMIHLGHVTLDFDNRGDRWLKVIGPVAFVMGNKVYSQGDVELWAEAEDYR